MVVSKNKKTIRNKPIIAFWGIVFIILILFFLFDYISYTTNYVLSNRFYNMGEDEGSGRLWIWVETINLQLQSDFYGWFLGHGYNAVKQTSLGLSAHNDFMEILYNYGIIVFLLYLLFYKQLYSYFRKLFKNKSLLYLSFGVSLIIFVILSSVSHLFVYPNYFIYLSSFMGLAIGISENIMAKENNASSYRKNIEFF